jgi:transcriptional regulator with XRE-family HTH domain
VKPHLTPKAIKGAEISIFRRAGREVLIAARRQLGYTQAQMGTLLGFSQTQISRIESGRTSPPAWTVMYFLHIWPTLISVLPEIQQRTRDNVKRELDDASAQSLISAHLAIVRFDDAIGRGAQKRARHDN